MKIYVYERSDSSFYWLRFPDGRSKSSRIKKNSGPDAKLALAELINKLEGELLKRARKRSDAPAKPKPKGTEFGAWVPAFISTRGQSELTRKQYAIRWRRLSAFLDSVGVSKPDELQREHGLQFIIWRTTQTFGKRRRPTKNHALQELKLLNCIMLEAVNRDYASRNPIARLGIKKDETPQKSEISAEEIAKIRAALPFQPEWMQVSFSIAYETGVRLRETIIDLTKDVDFGQNTLLIHPKGGEGKVFSLPMSPTLRAQLLKLRKRKQRWTWEEPTHVLISVEWRKFFDSLDLPHVCFHGLRVTFITAALRGGLSEPQAKKLVNHSSSAVHRVYQRHSVGDLQDWRSKIALPGQAA